MMMLVEPVDRQVALAAGGVDPMFHGRFGEDAGAGLVGCGAHGTPEPSSRWAMPSTAGR